MHAPRRHVNGQNAAAAAGQSFESGQISRERLVHSSATTCTVVLDIGSYVAALHWYALGTCKNTYTDSQAAICAVPGMLALVPTYTNTISLKSV